MTMHWHDEVRLDLAPEGGVASTAAAAAAAPPGDEHEMEGRDGSR